MELTENNHFTFGRLPDDEETFIAQCGPLNKLPLPPKETAVLAARRIFENANGLKIKLCLSGGIDSACMLEAFLESGVSFEAVFLRFKNSLNEFDISTNLTTCEALGVPFSFVDLDILQFFDSGEFLQTSEKYECQSPQMAAHLWLLDRVDGLPVMAGNPIAPIWRGNNWFFVGLPGELHSVYFKYFLLNNRPGVPMFFLYSPELISSFLHLQCMQPYINKQILNTAEYNYLEKCNGYKEGGFTSAPRANKYTGFEQVRKIYDDRHGTHSGVSFDRLFRAPLEKMFPFPENYIQLIPLEYLPKS